MSTNFETEGDQPEPLDQPTLSQRLMELFPERCRGCHRTEMLTLLTAADVDDGDISEEEAIKRIREDSTDVSVHCAFGRRAIAGINASSVCNYKKRR